MSADGVEFRLVDDDLVSNEKVLENASNRAFYIQLNQPGSGQFDIPVDDIKVTGLDVGKFVKVFYRGAIRGGFWIENIDKKEITPGEYSDKMMTCSGRGALAVLDEAIVWDYLTPGTDTVRKFVGVTKASMLYDLLDEAKNPHLPMDRKCFPMLSWSFTAAQDSLGNAWGDSEDMEFNVGTYLLEVQRQLVDLGIDFSISVNAATGALVLAAYKNPLGTDLHTTVKFRAGLNCQEVSQTKVLGNLRNRVLVHFKDGTTPYTSLDDAPSQALYRPRETLLQAENASVLATAQEFGQKELDKLKVPEMGIGIRFQDDPSWANSTNANEPFANWSVGDTISYNETNYRVLGMQLAWEGDNPYASITLELNRVLNTFEMRQAMDSKKLATASIGSALQTAPNSANALTYHDIAGAMHTTAGRTAGQVLIATGATTFSWSTFMLVGTATKTYTFPGTTGTVAIIGIANTFISGQIIGNGVGNALLYINGAAGSSRYLLIQTAGSARWSLVGNTVAEGGANAGTDFQLAAYDDAGAYLFSPLYIFRATGEINTYSSVTVPSSYNVTGKRVFQVGGSYPLTMGGGATSSYLGYIMHNAYASWTGAAGVFTWFTSHASFGSRSIHFSYGVNTGIEFYADSVATTAGTTFTPTLRMQIGNDGRVNIGANLASSVSTNSKFSVYWDSSHTAVANDAVIYGFLDANPAGASATNLCAGIFSSRTYVANAQNFTGTLIGVNSNVYHRGSGTVDEAYAGWFQTIVDGGGTITTGAAVRLLPPNISGAGSAITNSYALKIESQGATNWAIYSGTGKNYLGDELQVAGKFGCNTKSAQAAYASGGALAAYVTGANGLDTAAHMQALYNLVVAIRAALVADGIMS